jgi:2-phospho-L-lactate transferase/gluconeogenesis factor (CofD/UPF0052 family)
MTEAHESLNLTASEHIQALYQHAKRPIFDYALVNSVPVSEHMKAQYAEEQAHQVECDQPAIEALGVKCIAGDFVEENHFARHATDRLCQQLMRLAEIAEDHASQMPRPALR